MGLMLKTNDKNNNFWIENYAKKQVLKQIVVVYEVGVDWEVETHLQILYINI